ncbi:unnamed protein product [Thelazia callipaeda]|uniref:Peptidase S1 domain-containing protein n=1 Tax=Thelazia callipaeda TaxID=103827 RepID=A0A0N5D216_THECL|nr:unnamed protein product [Thelazia callipaeda]
MVFQIKYITLIFKDSAGVVDFALFTLDVPLPVCQTRRGRMFSIIKLPVEDIQADKWKFFEPSEKYVNECAIFGYGSSEKGGPDGELRRASNLSVLEVNRRLLIPLQMDRKKGRICGGDSGGPFVCDTDYGERLYGLLSHSEPLIYSQPPSCYGEVEAYLFDVMSGTREMLPHVKEALVKLNKLDEFIDDNSKCEVWKAETKNDRNF